MIKSKQLAKALYELSEENTANLDAKFLEFIERQNLKAQMPSVLYHLDKIIELDREKKGIVIETAHEIKDETVKKIKNFLAEKFPARNATHNVAGGPEVEIIKKELIGGFRAKWGGVIYDASIMTGLKKLKEEIIK
jgi:F0F1-type ATP synthase delta subunit